jgi:NADPH:quinone reductase-like Zn-dependent oxidoreductase
VWQPTRTASDPGWVDRVLKATEVRKDIWGAVESRKLQLPIDKVFKFDDIGKAFEHMEANRHLGKIVVTL